MSLLLALFACSNPCQQLCVDMAKYATDDCGLSFDKAELDACKEAYASPDEATFTQCQERSDPDALREWWSCDDLQENFSNAKKE